GGKCPQSIALPLSYRGIFCYQTYLTTNNFNNQNLLYNRKQWAIDVTSIFLLKNLATPSRAAAL
ncbi:MAG: hypothetical protein WC059_03225, partial [Candidatus Paceibacterota bacterium]